MAGLVDGGWWMMDGKPGESEHEQSMSMSMRTKDGRSSFRFFAVFGGMRMAKGCVLA